jgi:8-oxo-dGTP pyrophosphatase MutT (NUDIX family)
LANPSIPLPASTVVLVRPDDFGGFEVYMNRRPEQMDVYPGMYVFPGGRVEASDWSAATLRLVRGISAEEAKRLLGCDLAPELCLGHWVAAARELFEEVGIHFFLEQAGARLIGDTGAGLPTLSGRREALQRGTVNFAEMLASEALHCDLAQLAYFFHRITPEHYRTRFDTRFYVAALPRGQVPLNASEEVASSVWIAPQVALNASENQRFPILPPTVAVLRMLADQPSWSALKKTYRIR